MCCNVRCCKIALHVMGFGHSSGRWDLGWQQVFVSILFVPTDNAKAIDVRIPHLIVIYRSVRRRRVRTSIKRSSPSLLKV